MGRIGGKIYAIALLLLMAAGECLTVVYFAWTKAGTGVVATAYAIGGFLLAIILAPTVHELGHIVFAKAQGMRVVMTKFSFFSFWEEKSDPKQRGPERKSGMEIVFESFILTKYLFRKSLGGSMERLPGLYGRLQAGNGAVFCFDE